MGDFDIDLAYGKVRERFLMEILTDAKIEVKCERDIWKSTGNYVIEYAYKNMPSGIMTTDADWWAVVLCDSALEESRKHGVRRIILMPVEEAMLLYKRYKDDMFRQKKMGDDNEARGILIPLSAYK
jgi:hypothetical protein